MPNYRALYPGGYFSSKPLDKSAGPVSIRMNNPGAINGAKWEREIPGYAGEHITSYSEVGGRRVPNVTTYFETPEAGIVAYVKLLDNYRKQGATTIRQIITKYGGGQNYSGYIKDVTNRTGLPADKVIDFRDDAVLLPFAKAMFRHEAGVDMSKLPWRDEQIVFGFQLGRVYVDTGTYDVNAQPSTAPSRPPAAPVARPQTSWWEWLFGSGAKAPGVIRPPSARPLLRDGMNTEEIQALQQWHIDAGILDPLADGKAGPLTRWSLTQPVPAKIDLAGGDLAARSCRVFLDNDWWLCRVPDCANLFYIEGANLDGSRNENRPNEFNDVRFDLRFRSGGAPYIHSVYRATTEPGKYWTEHRMNPGGAFRIAFGQKKAWTHGTYNGMLALRQAGVISGFRDNNEDFNRQGDAIATGDNFGVHHHGGYNYPVDDLGRSSAGCLVVRSMTEHDQSMRSLRKDLRYLAAGGGYRVVSTVFPYDAFTSNTEWRRFIA